MRIKKTEVLLGLIRKYKNKIKNARIDIFTAIKTIKNNISIKNIFSLPLLILKYFYVEMIIVCLIPIVLYMTVSICSSKHIYSSTENIPYNDVALVLGTSKYRKDGTQNLYFKYRIEAAYKLYKEGKVKYILVSGDNRHIYYNEPLLMRNDLIKLGVLPEHIYTDFAGFRTLDSVLRANAVFEESNFTIVSQGFHNARAIFIARFKGLNAVAYNAYNVPFIHRVLQTPREMASRMLMIFDLLTNKKAYFYGETIEIGGTNYFQNEYALENESENTNE